MGETRAASGENARLQRRRRIRHGGLAEDNRKPVEALAGGTTFGAMGKVVRNLCRLAGGEYAIHEGAQPRLNFFAGHSVQVLNEINELSSKTPAGIAMGALQQGTDGFPASGEKPFGSLFGNVEGFCDLTIAVVFIVS